MTKFDRSSLPQIPGPYVSDFRTFLNGYGIGSTLVVRDVNRLKPIQKHVNKEKVKSILASPSALTQPLIVSSDNFILDGHHRWIANKEIDKQDTFCIVCHCSIADLIELGLQFPKAEVKSIHECMRY